MVAAIPCGTVRLSLASVVYTPTSRGRRLGWAIQSDPLAIHRCPHLGRSPTRPSTAQTGKCERSGLFHRQMPRMRKAEEEGRRNRHLALGVLGVVTSRRQCHATSLCRTTMRQTSSCAKELGLIGAPGKHPEQKGTAPASSSRKGQASLNKCGQSFWPRARVLKVPQPYARHLHITFKTQLQ
jgi:hypothetical protein